MRQHGTPLLYISSISVHVLFLVSGLLVSFGMAQDKRYAHEKECSNGTGHDEATADEIHLGTEKTTVISAI
jgi:hypothetical protein